VQAIVHLSLKALFSFAHEKRAEMPFVGSLLIKTRSKIIVLTNLRFPTEPVALHLETLDHE